MSWPLVQIGKYADKVRTWNPAAGEECIFQYVDLSSVDKSRKVIDLDNVAEISSAEAPSRARQLVVAGDVLVATVRPNLNGVAVVPAELNGATASTGYCVLRADEKNLHGRYLFHWVQTGSFVEDMMSKATGANYPAVSDKIVKESKIPLPPLPEQKRIAAILDKADAIRRKRQQAIQLADDFLRAVFLDMFGDPVTNPKRWPTMRVDELCTIVRGSSPRPQGDPRFYVGPVPRLMVADLTRDGKVVTPMIDSLTAEGAKKSRPIEAGTVVMAVSGNVGLTSVLAIDACIHDGFIAFKELDVNKVKPAFLCELMMFLKSTHASRQAGAIFQNLTTSQIKEMEIPIPPLELQDKFLSISRKATELYGEEGFSLFESLSQRAFSGQL
ncbi:restriction endonuclease subunit S [Stutzerimonas balearica]|uniref:restriction endonuclease subunit S n=1 Tax=Stutzerimonas balearica TaxID=74829 RepID=UPI0028A1795D|nr:restriction endonuclease subunit S [Stutzerimonas balearica]